MSRKHDRKEMVMRNVRALMESPQMMYYFTSKMLRKRPKYVPKFIWGILLRIVLAA